MALRKPIFISSSGYAEEMAASDSIALGALTMSGAIAMGTNKITGLAQADSTGDALAWGQNASIANLTVTGSLQAALDAGTYKITNLGNPSSAQDAATKFYVDSVKTGLDFKQSVRAIAKGNITLSGTQTVDGVSLVAGDRILVAGQTSAATNGIYVVAAGAWSRAEDADSSAELNAGAYCFVEEGTLYKETGWIMTSDEVFTLGTSEMFWVQFSSAGVVLAGIALEKVGNTLNVLEGDGIAVNGSNQLVVDLATDPGLQFSSGKLDLKLVSADRLSKSASGLDVTGVPSLFKIDGSAVSSNVTASNLGTLTAGIDSDATALHQHKRIEASFTAAAGLAAGDAVYQSANDTVAESDAGDDAKRWVTGVARAVAGGAAKVVSHGVCPGVLSGATAGDKYYVQDGGGIGTSQPGAGKNLIVVGFAINATDLFVSVIDQGKKAA